jgi:CubicO group peptidase (beta-lactamase class C family)
LKEDIEERVSRICRDLRPETPFPGREEPACSLADRMAHGATPGISVAIVDNFSVAWARGYGKRATETADSVTPNTPFQAGSISKPVFALAVMKLVEAGELDLDADVNDYLSGWQVPANNGWRPRLSLRQLLSHTAGTTVHGFPGYPSTGSLPTVLQTFLGLPPANNPPIVVDLLPGTQFRYSGGGTTIAQQVVVDVLKKPFSDLMRELVLDPLCMSDSTFEQPLPAAMADRAATAHPWNGVQTQGGWHVYPEMAAAGLWTTAADLAKLGAEVMRALRGDLTKLKLGREAVADMLRPQLRGQKIGQDFVGLGWFCSGEGDLFRFGHQGGNEGFLAEMRMFPALGHGVVVMINSIQGWFLRDELIQAIGREYQWPPSRDIPTSTALIMGTAYSGLYRSDDGASVRVTQTTETLLLHFDQQSPVPLLPTTSGEFFARAINLRVRFSGSDAATLDALALILNGNTINFSRVGN